MSSFKHPEDHKDLSPAKNTAYDLCFYELRGSRYVFRLTRLGLALIIVPTLLSMVAIIVLYLFRDITSVENTNITITVPSESPTPMIRPLIKPAPPPSPIPKIRPSSNDTLNQPREGGNSNDK